MGLLVQEAAFSAGPAMVETKATGAMPADCMEMMQGEQPEPAKNSCDGLTLDCIAIMGCVIPLVVPTAPVSPDGAPYLKVAHFPPPTSPLPGLLIGPEPDPPTFLI